MRTNRFDLSGMVARLARIVRAWGWPVGVVRPAGLLLALVGLAGVAEAQSGDFDEPQVVLDTGGHQAPPRVIRFTPDGRQMLTAGMDKVIRVWDLDGGRPRLAGTLRPPIWRGPAGIIYALALSPLPIPGEPGQHYLAVAGYGVSDSRGNIGLYRFPGSIARPTGDLVRPLPVESLGQQATIGHTDTVMALAFSPDGRTLASAGLDGRILLWNVVDGSLVRVLTNPNQAGIDGLAYSADGAVLVSGDHAGIVRIWDARTGTPLRASAALRRRDGGRADDPRSDQILTLAVNPRGPLQWVIVGREDGWLLRYDAGLRAPVVLPTRDDQGPVEAVAVDATGSRLATSIIASRLRDAGELPSVACDIELRRLPDGMVLGSYGRSDNLVYAVAFSPDGRFAAYGGGDAQAVTLVAPRNVPSAIDLRGQGWSVWDVGWTGDSRTVGFSRSRPPRLGAPASSYEGFDLFERHPAEVVAADLSRSQVSWNGHSVVPVDPLALVLVGPDGRRTRLELDRQLHRRWWSYSVLPPGPGHPRPCLAVGCDAGVLIFDAATGRLNRLYAGHSGPVLALAPSPDGRWLATGSSDQTVRIWRLAECDQPAALGLSWKRDGAGGHRVAAVERLGFAGQARVQLAAEPPPGRAAGERLRIEADDLLEQGFLRSEAYPPLPLAEFVAQANAAPPGLAIKMQFRRGDRQLWVLTTKRDAPALSLFVGLDREWVLWMPQGYYDTSIAGDRKYLVWHRNGRDAAQPTDTFPADRFERELRLPDVLATLLRTGDLAEALDQVPPVSRQPEQLVAAGAPPIVRLGGLAGLVPGAALVTPNPVVTLTPEVVADDGRSPIREIRVQDGARTLARVPLAGPVPRFQAPIRFTVPPGGGPRQISVVAINEQGRERVAGVPIAVTAPALQPARLAVLAIGVSGPFPAAAQFERIAFADQDAADVRSKLGELGKPAFGEHVLLYPVIAEASATSSVIRDAFDRVHEDRLGPGDTLLVLFETHFRVSAQGGYFVASDAGPGDPPANAIPADDLADALAGVAEAGCRVLLLIDALHKDAPAASARGFKEWARSVSNRGVVTFVASNHGPSERSLSNQHGAFALGVLEAQTARGRSRPWADPASALTLDDFQSAVIRRVEELTSRRQRALCTFPETISPASLLFDAAPVPVAAGR